jgi:hypothetical protein
MDDEGSAPQVQLRRRKERQGKWKIFAFEDRKCRGLKSEGRGKWTKWH